MSFSFFMPVGFADILRKVFINNCVTFDTPCSQSEWANFKTLAQKWKFYCFWWKFRWMIDFWGCLQNFQLNFSYSLMNSKVLCPPWFCLLLLSETTTKLCWKGWITEWRKQLQPWKKNGWIWKGNVECFQQPFSPGRILSSFWPQVIIFKQENQCNWTEYLLRIFPRIKLRAATNACIDNATADKQLFQWKSESGRTHPETDYTGQKEG